MPGRCAAPPAPAMSTRRPRSAAVRPYAIIFSGWRCAETTSISTGTSNSASASAAAFITGQSESEPMTIATWACAAIVVSVQPSAPRWRRAHHVPAGGAIGALFASGGRLAAQERRRRDGPPTDVVEIVTADVHVPELAAGAHLLAVQVHLRAGVGGRHLGEGFGRVGQGAAQDVRHDGPRRACRGVA